MKVPSGKQSLWWKVSNLALAAVVLGGALFIGVTPSLAAAPPQLEGVGERGAPRLEFAYLRLQQAAEDQALHLGHAGEAADFLQEWIDSMTKEGQDISQLQAALDAFQATLVEAQAHLDEAQSILDTHVGFDDNGQVTDREQAVETLREGGRSLREARRALKDGSIELRRAIHDWRRDHRQQSIEAPGAATG